MTEPFTTEELAVAIVRLLRQFEQDPQPAIDGLGPLYDEDVVFRDPLQTVHGRDAFIEMNRRIVAKSRSTAFDIRAKVVQEETIALEWTMTFVPIRLPSIRFEGASILQARAGLVVRHSDYWDLPSSVASSLPLAGKIYRALSARLA